MVTETNEGICIDDFIAGGSREGKYGVGLISNKRICMAVGAYTKNRVKGSHIVLDKKILKGGVQTIIINSGCANACVPEGLEDAREMARIAAEYLHIDKKNIAVASTGIIGQRLDLEKIRKITNKITLSKEGGIDCARAIMTTDTIPKMLSVEYKGIKIGAIAKGAGMIAPNMATMLCFITTNANIRREDLKDALNEAVDDSFNMLCIDGDMSPNDTVILISNSKVKCVLSDFKCALNYVVRKITKLLAYDAEGATKLLEVRIVNAKTQKKAKKGVMSIINSPLVKTAMFGENPNWGRIVSSIGRVIDFNFNKMSLKFRSERGEAALLENGTPLGNSEKAADILKGREIEITVNLNDGREYAVGWGCDLSYGYVKINAEYN